MESHFVRGHKVYPKAGQHLFLIYNSSFVTREFRPSRHLTFRLQLTVPQFTKLFLNMTIEPQVRRFCGPLFFVSSNVTPKGTINGSGTFGLIDTGQKKLLVTCWHVVFGPGGFQEVHSNNSDFRFGVGFGGQYSHSIAYKDLMEMMVDESRRCDLATFDVSDALDLVAASNLEFYNLKANRPPKIQVSDVLYLIGFPSKDRIENEKSVGHIRTPFGVQASYIGESTFQADVKNLPLNETDYGGISGAPCFIVNESSVVRLVGFATGYSGPSMNMLQFTYARFIGEDGIIRYMT
jgi:hypothetical protein